VTVAHLLSHSSGLPNYTDFAEFSAVEQQPSTPDQVVARFRDLPLGFTPGSVYHYTNSNYVLLGTIIERASGQSYPDYMQQELFAPLGMADSGYDPGDFGPLNGTRGYAGGALDIPLNTSNLYAAGGLYSTVEDLFKLAQALDSGRLLSDELTARMVTPAVGRYGFGWMVEQRGANRLVYHPGSMSGAATWFGRYPDAGLTIIVLSNDYYADVYSAADYLASLVLGP
jgi:CubicO group peptidase (beta-lactamase class C family)